MSNYRAIDVMYAINRVFNNCGDNSYAIRRTNNFLRRCGADITKPKEQLLSAARVKEVAHAMLDIDAEKALFSILEGR